MPFYVMVDTTQYLTLLILIIHNESIFGDKLHLLLFLTNTLHLYCAPLLTLPQKDFVVWIKSHVLSCSKQYSCIKVKAFCVNLRPAALLVGNLDERICLQMFLYVNHLDQSLVALSYSSLNQEVKWLLSLGHAKYEFKSLYNLFSRFYFQ